METIISIIIPIIISTVVAVIGFFLKRTIDRVDNSEKRISAIREDYTPKDTHQKDIDECRGDIKQIKDDYITKSDFFREQSKTERKLDAMDRKFDTMNGKFDKVMDVLMNFERRIKDE